MSEVNKVPMFVEPAVSSSLFSEDDILTDYEVGFLEAAIDGEGVA